MLEYRPFPLIHPRKKFALFTNAKCGGTLLKTWFLGTLDFVRTFSSFPRAVSNFGLGLVYDWYRYHFGVHDTTRILAGKNYLRRFIAFYRKSTYPVLKHALEDPAYYRFAVLRDPLSRLVSAYVDKFCGQDLNKPFVRQVLQAAGRHGEISFEQFVRFLATHDNDGMDPHWRRQSYILNSVKLDRMLDLKQLSSDLPEICEHLGVPISVDLTAPRQAQSYAAVPGQEHLFVGDLSNQALIRWKAENGHFPAKQAFYNDGLEATVRQVYAADFELLALCQKA